MQSMLADVYLFIAFLCCLIQMRIGGKNASSQPDDIMQNDTQHSQCNNIKCYDRGKRAVKMNIYCTIYQKVFITFVQ